MITGRPRSSKLLLVSPEHGHLCGGGEGREEGEEEEEKKEKGGRDGCCDAAEKSEKDRSEYGTEGWGTGEKQQ